MRLRVALLTAGSSILLAATQQQGEPQRIDEQAEEFVKYYATDSMVAINANSSQAASLVCFNQHRQTCPG
jgi:hypothetical protein